MSEEEVRKSVEEAEAKVAALRDVLVRAAEEGREWELTWTPADAEGKTRITGKILATRNAPPKAKEDAPDGRRQ